MKLGNNGKVEKSGTLMLNFPKPQPQTPNPTLNLNIENVLF